MGKNTSILAETVFATQLALRISETKQLLIAPIEGSPEGRELGSPGSQRIDLLTGNLWIKRTAASQATGWELIIGSETDGIFSAADYGAIPDGRDNTESLEHVRARGKLGRRRSALLRV